jgi:hypothetical protein
MTRQSFVYILCIDPPRRVHDGDMYSNYKRDSPPVSHYVGYTTQDWPVNRALKDHHIPMKHLVYLAPGSEKDEEEFKRNGRCPRCHKTLDYHAEARLSPEYQVNKRAAEASHAARRTERQNRLNLFSHQISNLEFELGDRASSFLIHENTDYLYPRLASLLARLRRTMSRSQLRNTPQRGTTRTRPSDSR